MAKTLIINFSCIGTMLIAFIVLWKVWSVTPFTIDIVDCGVDNEPTVDEGDVDVTEYPWIGLLYYEYWGGTTETRSVTTVTLIHREFVIGASADIGPMPKKDFRKKTRVLLGEDWGAPGRRVRNYILHPDYEETYNTICLVQLKDRVKNPTIRPICPPPNILKNPEFYVLRMKFDAESVNKEVIRVVHIPGKMCKDFYVAANLYSKKMRPPHVACAVEIKTKDVCVWSAGHALVSRDAWGRWQLLGVGVRGPGCGAPSRYLDMMSYYPWIEDSLSKFSDLTISKLSSQKYALRYSAHETSGGLSPELKGGRIFQRFGACDEEEKENLLYREVLSLRTDGLDQKTISYNLTIHQNIVFTCLTLELINASASSEIYIKHLCDRYKGGPSCYKHRMTTFDVIINVIFRETCLFELAAWGHVISMKLVDIQEWKWREGEHYDDFDVERVEYRGTPEMTGFGFEPLDKSEWIKEYDLWTTTQATEETTMQPKEYLPPELRWTPPPSKYRWKKPKYGPNITDILMKRIRPHCLFWFICWDQTNPPAHWKDPHSGGPFK